MHEVEFTFLNIAVPRSYAKEVWHHTYLMRSFLTKQHKYISFL